MTPTTSLLKTETQLVQGLHGAARALDTIATDRTQAALQSLREAAGRARDRIRDTLDEAASIIGELCLDLSIEVEAVSQDVAGALAEGQGGLVLLGLIGTAPEATQEARQEPAAVEPAPEPSAEPIAPQQATQEQATQDDYPDMVDLGWEPTQEDLDRAEPPVAPAVQALCEAAEEAEQEQLAQAAACPPVKRDDLAAATKKTTRRKPR